MLKALRRQWPEYLMEAAGLGIYMISVAAVGTILGYPGSPIRPAIADPVWRRDSMRNPSVSSVSSDNPNRQRRS